MAITEEVPQVIEKIVEVVRLIPQERIQQRTVEQMVVVPVLQVVKEMVEVDQIIPQSVSSTETLMCQWRYNAKDQQSRPFRGQWKLYKYRSLIEWWMCLLWCRKSVINSTQLFVFAR